MSGQCVVRRLRKRPACRHCKLPLYGDLAGSDCCGGIYHKNCLEGLYTTSQHCVACGATHREEASINLYGIDLGSTGPKNDLETKDIAKSIRSAEIVSRVAKLVKSKNDLLRAKEKLQKSILKRDFYRKQAVKKDEEIKASSESLAEEAAAQERANVERATEMLDILRIQELALDYWDNLAVGEIHKAKHVLDAALPHISDPARLVAEIQRFKNFMEGRDVKIRKEEQLGGENLVKARQALADLQREVRRATTLPKKKRTLDCL